jgi:hypothetical protein
LGHSVQLLKKNFHTSKYFIDCIVLFISSIDTPFVLFPTQPPTMTKEHQGKITTASVDAAKPTPPPGLPSVQQRMKSLQLATRRHDHSDDGKRTTDILLKKSRLTTQTHGSIMTGTTTTTKEKQKSMKDCPGFHALVLPPLSQPAATKPQQGTRQGHVRSFIDDSNSIPSEIIFSNGPYNEFFHDDGVDDCLDEKGWSLGVCAVTTHANQAAIFRNRDEGLQSSKGRLKALSPSSPSSHSHHEEMSTKQIWNLQGRTAEEKDAKRSSQIIDGSDIRGTSRPRFMRVFRHQTKNVDVDGQPKKKSPSKAEF